VSDARGAEPHGERKRRVLSQRAESCIAQYILFQHKHLRLTIALFAGPKFKF